MSVWKEKFKVKNWPNLEKQGLGKESFGVGTRALW